MTRKKNIENNTKTDSNEVEVVGRMINKVLSRKVSLKCKNRKQKAYTNLIKEYEMTFCSGPPGVGKSYVAIATAIQLVQDRGTPYEKILIVKPAVEVEEKLGYLPGDLKEKLAPYLASSIDIVDKIIGEGCRIKLEESKEIMAEPLGFIRGKSIDNSIVLVEEAQNISPSQMKSLLTRIGSNSKFVISGDLGQSDRYKDGTKSGLYDAINRHSNIPELGFFEFDVNDIVRNPLITKIVNNYKEGE